MSAKTIGATYYVFGKCPVKILSKPPEGTKYEVEYLRDVHSRSGKVWWTTQAHILAKKGEIRFIEACALHPQLRRV